MARPPTIYDVAERAGVSKSLVSLVLRGSARVSDEKRAAVLQAVDDLRYTPSHLASGLAGTGTRNIGVMIDDFANLWFVEALHGLREALTDERYSLSIADAALNAHLGLDPLAVFRSLRVDGVVLAGEVSAEAADRLGVPAVILGTRSLHLPGLPTIASDEKAGGRLATAHLAELGHRRIACVSAPGASAGDREAGYLAEMRDRGLTPFVVHATQTTEEAAYRAAGSLLDGGNRPTAVFAVNDPMAVGVLGALRDDDLDTPEDVSVVGYDNSPLAGYDYLCLSSVDGGMHELGVEAGRALLKSLDGDPRPQGPRLLEPRLVARNSTGSPKQ